MSHARWPVLKVRTRIRNGWSAWESRGSWMWARFRDNKVEAVPIPPDELEVLDEVLSEDDA